MRDTRMVGPLCFLLLRDRDDEVRAAAARMLGRMPTEPPLDPRAEQALLRVARTSADADSVRIAAIEALRWIGGEESGSALREIYTRPQEAEEVRAAAREALAARWPAELDKRAPVVEDRSGRATLVGGSTLLGSYTLGAIGGLGRNKAGTAIGVLGGAVVGGVTASYLTRTGEITKAQAGWMISAGMWGAGIGMTTAAAMQRDPDHRLVLSLGLLGEGAAFGAAFATRKGLRYSASDVGEINVAGALAVDLALGGLLVSLPDDPRASFAVVTGASVAGLAAGLALARDLKFSSRDSSLITLAGYEGLWLGALAPTAWTSPVEDDNHYAAGMLLGTGLGVLGGAALAQYTEIKPRNIGLIWLFGSYGKLLGYSVPLLKWSTTISDARGVFVGSVGGLATGALVADKLDIRRGDSALIALGTVVGGWHGLGLGIAAEREGRRLGGLVTLGTSVAGLGTVGLSQAVKLDVTDVQALAGGLFWGSWFSAWGAALADMDLEPGLRLTVLSGDVGLAVGGLLVSPAVNLDPRRIGVAYLGGLSGAALLSLGAALVTRDNDTLIKANLIGSGAGLTIGGLVATRMKFSPRKPRGASAVAAASSWPALRAPVVTPLVLAPPSGAGSMPGVGIAATFLE